MKVLTITPWYPSEKDQMAGLFVQNFVDKTTKLGAVHKVFSKVGYYDILKGLIYYSKKRNRPDIVHLHIATKQGLIALGLSKFCNVPYIITEHWSGYYPENGSFNRLCKRPIIGRISKQFTKKVFKNAAIVTAVSKDFVRQLKELHLIEDGMVLYNIVSDFFVPVSLSSTEGNHGAGKNICHFINVTCFDNKAKNLTGIIDAVKTIRDKDFILTFIGDGNEKELVMNYANSQGVADKIRFTGEVDPTEVANFMQKASCLILNSNYETACVVLQEALVTGLPIISTPVGIAPEFREHIELIERNNPEMLANAMARFIENPKGHYQGIEDFDNSPKQLYSMYETLLHSR